MSSDVASSRFFNRTMSTRSSTSSAEEVPPLPKPAFVGHHIVPPSELGKDDMTPLVDAGAKKVHPRLGQLHLPSPSLNIPPRLGLGREDDWMIVDTPAAELTSLPFPPRRPRAMVSKSEMEDETEVVEKDMERERDRPASPEIPSFSTAGAINAFPRRGSSGSSLKVSSPTSPQSTSLPAIIPPRPPRSMERPAPQPQSQSPDESGSAQAQIISMGRKSESAVSPNHHRHSSGSTMRPWRRSSSFGSKSQSKVPSTPTRPSTAVPSSSSSRLTFRELSSSGKKYALTEKEKADIWDDLLERSDRAGGTLHLGAAEDLLMSDKLSMRMSVASEVPSL
ncbi:hypothetical protein BDQ17DRAFT_552279 [Cyathus striatus]|nr:hypothetical protein BDQ17DRAFT_552279 [Cyathus striatus]